MMSEQGYSRDGEQRKTKIKNLKKMYTAVKDHNNVTGNDKKTCSFFDELDAILGHRPASAPTVVLDASAGGLSEEPTEEREEGKREYGMAALYCLWLLIYQHLMMLQDHKLSPKVGHYNNNYSYTVLTLYTDDMSQKKKQKNDTGGAIKGV